MDILKEFHADHIDTRYAVDETPDDHDFHMHIHDRYEIFFFLSGDAQYLVEGVKYRLQPYDIMMMRPCESHRIQILNPVRYERYTVNFHSEMIERDDPHQQLLEIFQDRPLGKNNRIHPEGVHQTMISRIFQNIALCKGDHYQKNLKIKINLFMLLDLLCDLYQCNLATQVLPVTLSGQIISYVNEHLFEDISIPALAQHFCISPSHFSRIFKQAAGAAPWEYIRLKRLAAAREMIRSGISVTKAAENTGFGDYSSFYRAYFQCYGCSPRNDPELLRIRDGMEKGK